ncbi:hypothetical protein CHO01_17140 [Cellulomonas hominis]|uniref:Uncharacterized protein n=1 Tax=Cellulomonas hominis TaxID=156981 RepID=A0A511FFJ8_9CELL|nr:hypothetical protein [Cellulomonas hominis]MBB5474560.1 hypothetical protein [Cellulomonas hominis]NKY05602.1 hypothetical protein [Cellulomonas hominis]GEL46598.1 hypothetical protein CHO01_17140 [Cellulomonas hominis]
MSLAWTYRAWGAALPSLGTDHLGRHILVLPWPLRTTETAPEDGTRYHPALALVVAPWWACRHVLRDAQVRRYLAWERRRSRDLTRAGPGANDEHIETIYRRWEHVRPAHPDAWRKGDR